MRGLNTFEPKTSKTSVGRRQVRPSARAHPPAVGPNHPGVLAEVARLLVVKRGSVLPAFGESKA